MTTIAVTTNEIGSDLQYTEEAGQKKWKGGPKVFFCEKHEATYPHADFYVGLCGAATALLEVASFFMSPDQVQLPKRISGVGGAILTTDGKIFCFDHPRVWIQVREKFYAIGSGGNVAMGALAMGASVQEAIKAASKVDAFTGMGSKVFKI